VKLDGIHHITAITADAPGNVDFYTRVLGLRMVKKTVNQDDPSVYHLFYADERGSAGSDLTFFEYPSARRGRPGAGMVHTIGYRVASEAALDFWQARLSGEGVHVERGPGRLRFADPEGMRYELEVSDSDDRPLIADHPEIPAEVALQGFSGVRVFARDGERGRELLEDTLGFEQSDEGRWTVRGRSRGSYYQRDPAPADPPVPGAGTVHHVAWASELDEQDAWQQRVADAGVHPTPVIDRFYFRSIYFREGSGVLFEIATKGPGFATDEPIEHLGERLSLPPAFEHLRDQLDGVLTPLPDTRPRVSS
jgi:glyoxalase family protein